MIVHLQVIIRSERWKIVVIVIVIKSSLFILTIVIVQVGAARRRLEQSPEKITILDHTFCRWPDDQLTDLTVFFLVYLHLIFLNPNNSIHFFLTLTTIIFWVTWL